MTRLSGNSKPCFAELSFRTGVILFFLAAAGLSRPAVAADPQAAAPAAPESTGSPTESALPKGPPPPVPGPTLWIDFEKNAARLTSPEAIEAVVDSAYRSGFSRLIVDLKKADGSVVFKSRRAPRIDLPFDYFGSFRKSADRRGMEVIADFEVFTEGDTRTGKGPAYDHPEWQTVIGNVETGHMPQSEFYQKGPVLYANPESPAVQQYEASVIEDLLNELKPAALMLDEMRFFTRDADMSDSTHIRFEAWAGLNHASTDPANPNGTCWPGSVQRTNSPRIPIWTRFRVGVIHEFLGRIRTLQERVAPETAIYLSTPGYYEAAVSLGLNWSHSSYKPVLWYADEKFQKQALADLVDQMIILNRDANPRAVSEVIRGTRTVTQDKLPSAVLIEPGLHSRNPIRFRECIQTVRDSGVGLVISDLNLLGSLDYWTIVSEEFPRH
jgi:uncharacterized lipoprotein YddW (UPF0748 family)